MRIRRLINFNILCSIMSVFLFSSCQTAKWTPSGIQEGYEAVNPASVIAIPVFMLPDPSKSSSIDPAIVNTHQIISKIQEKVIQSFNKQPNINGHSFAAVSNIIGNTKPSLLDNLNESMKIIANRFKSNETSTRTLITSSCLARKNFLEFYIHCVSPDKLWIENLNTLAAKVLNADTALIVVINDIESNLDVDIYSINGGFSVLLVDTNNGKLIWGRDGYASLQNPKEKKYYPSWDDLINSIFNEQFWDKFPGRIVNQKKT
ncbi:hypothetical protein [Silvanigrella aquatica]|uniref:Lipoprotein n=1 Tax=Silvanigrella aquatica TaxID=1915309 RepID=A0A1L4D3U7_9BACT|nr:hypothetical protein [Silvanigrella aquatica]APJ04895.1 hypothetical protein AXG55_13735 [Silvanigrella aquatica]